MADTTDPDALKPMTDGDVSASAKPKAAAPLKGATTGEGGTLSGATQTLKDKTADLRGQATDKARLYAEDGKARASGALEQLAQMLTDAAGQVDEKVGAQYGQYARTAADKVQGFSSSLNDQSVDDIVDTARDFVRKSPAVAIGAAAALGFVVARLLTAGLDQRDKV